MSGRGGGVDGGSSSTYEQAMASSRESALPDRVRWDRDSSFRDQPYRFLHHQGGIVGHVSVRLIEARNLRRPNDDGGGGSNDERDKISSYAVLHLSSGDGDDEDSADGLAVAGSSDGGGGGGKKRAASDRIIEERMDLSSSSHSHSSLSSTSRRSEAFRSSVVPHTNDPTWTSTRAGDSSFSIPLRKNFVRPDGDSVYVNVEMNERDTGGKLLFAGRDRPLGSAAINVSPVLFGEEGVMDVWLDLREPDHYHRHSAPYAVAASAAAADRVDRTYADAAKERRRRSCGRVRLLVAYEPRGMQPREGDVVCLEAFARSPTNLIFNPLAQPMRVLAARGDYLLVRYGTASYSRPGRSTARAGGGSSAVEKQTGQVRLHRNAVFVIERFTLVDGVVDLALKPADVLGSIPAVRWAGEAVSPYAGVVGDLAMPAVLSAKLVMAAARTAGTAGITGVATTGKVLLMAVAAGKRDRSQEQLDRERAEEESRRQYQRGGGW